MCASRSRTRLELGHSHPAQLEIVERLLLNDNDIHNQECDEFTRQGHIPTRQGERHDRVRHQVPTWRGERGRRAAPRERADVQRGDLSFVGRFFGEWFRYTR